MYMMQYLIFSGAGPSGSGHALTQDDKDNGG